MKLLLHLAASLAAIVLIPRPAGAQSTVGNLTCFRISDPMPRAKFQVTLGGEAGSMHCTLKAPANRACIATSGTVVSPPPPEAGGGADVSTSFLCYQARCSPGPGAASLEDAFGRRAVALVASPSLPICALLTLASRCSKKTSPRPTGSAAIAFTSTRLARARSRHACRSRSGSTLWRPRPRRRAGWPS